MTARPEYTTSNYRNPLQKEGALHYAIDPEQETDKDEQAAKAIKERRARDQQLKEKVRNHEPIPPMFESTIPELPRTPLAVGLRSGQKSTNESTRIVIAAPENDQQEIRENQRLEAEARARNEARIQVFDQRLAQRKGEMAAELLRTNEPIEPTPAERAERLVAARTQAMDTLRALEQEAMRSFFGGLSSLATRARERARIASYTRQLETLYREYPSTRTPAERARIAYNETEAGIYNARRHTTILEAARRGTPGAERNEAFVRAFNQLSLEEQHARMQGLDAQSRLTLNTSLERIRELEREIATVRPSFLNRVFGNDPVAEQRKELAYRLKRANDVFEKHPDLF
ncbi:MAG: hypothetical protein KIH62_004185 [Candidatus Kerfeldbacteria bacterium]|nr:hypothetical protein [Candidatus Kerfeldbacteria bacterium]